MKASGKNIKLIASLCIALATVSTSGCGIRPEACSSKCLEESCVRGRGCVCKKRVLVTCDGRLCSNIPGSCRK